MNIFLSKSIWMFAEVTEGHFIKKNQGPDKGSSVFFLVKQLDKCDRWSHNPGPLTPRILFFLIYPMKDIIHQGWDVTIQIRNHVHM